MVFEPREREEGREMKGSTGSGGWRGAARGRPRGGRRGRAWHEEGGEEGKKKKGKVMQIRHLHLLSFLPHHSSCTPTTTNHPLLLQR